MTYLLPAMKCVDDRRHVILECLERSRLLEGVGKQFSGVGLVHKSRAALPDHILNIYHQVDAPATETLLRSGVDQFPVKRLFNVCKEYHDVWDTSRFKKFGLSASNKNSSNPFPYVDERAAVLQELTKTQILKTRHRVNSDSHPKWALRTIRRRRRKGLVKAKKRSISQESIRTLQAKLLAAKSSSSKAT